MQEKRSGIPFGEAYRSSTRRLNFAGRAGDGTLRGIVVAALAHEYFNTMHKEDAK